jgi:hypothetical protein
VHALTRLALAAVVAGAAVLPLAPAAAYCENNETNACEPSDCDRLAAAYDRLDQDLTGGALPPHVVVCPQD